MSVMIEIYYPKPADPQRELAIRQCLAKHKGNVTFHEDDGPKTICLTAEFLSREDDLAAGTALRVLGEHVEGPYDY